MSRKKYDAVANIGEYHKNGETKKRYLTVGAVFENDKGQLSMKIDALPTGPEWSGWINFYEPKPYDGGESRQQSQPARKTAAGGPVSDSSDFDDQDDIPF